jgi:hypothetical protein
MPCEDVVWLQPASNKGEKMMPSNSGVFHRVAINKSASFSRCRPVPGCGKNETLKGKKMAKGLAFVQHR